VEARAEVLVWAKEKALLEEGSKMDYQERFSSNKLRMEMVAKELNTIEQKKRALLEEAAKISGEQRLLQELIKEGKKDEQES